jgi:hypothetical protein
MKQAIVNAKLFFYFLITFFSMSAFAEIGRPHVTCMDQRGVPTASFEIFSEAKIGLSGTFVNFKNSIFNYTHNPDIESKLNPTGSNGFGLHPSSWRVFREVA